MVVTDLVGALNELPRAARYLALLTFVVSGSIASAADVSIHRDQWGVPHVTGPTDASVVFGYVYAQAQDNFWQIEDTLIQALGRYSEIMGEAALAGDYLNRALRLTKISKDEYRHLDPEEQALLKAAAAGLNQFVKDTNTESRLISRFEPWHFLAISRFTQYQLFVFNRARIRNNEIAAFATTSEGEHLEAAHFTLGSLAPTALNAVADAQAQAGSNTWAVAPHRSRSGRALLFINPHQPYFGPGQWHEGHLHSEEGLHFSGAGFFGSPIPTIGRNEHLGWSHTVNEPDIVDVYAIEPDSIDAPISYRWGNDERLFEHWTDTIKVNADIRTFNFKSSHHGPIVAVREGKLLAVRMAKFVEGGQLSQRLAMWRSTNLNEFKAALAQTATPMFNTMYADVHGDIYYAYYGAVPVRDATIDWSKTVSGNDPATDWQGYHGLNELPTLTNPQSGYLQNCNATPFLATAAADNLNPDDYPTYMVAEDDNNRSRMSRILLGGTDRLSFKEFERMTWDTRVLEADTMIPMLATELAARDLPPARRQAAQRALRHLQRWNKRAEVKSSGTTLYFYWRYTMRQLGQNDPVAAFEQALDYMLDTYGTWRVPWGEVNRLQRAHTSGTQGFDDTARSLPVAGGPGNPFGVIFNLYARPTTGAKRMYGIAGHSYVSIVEFAQSPQAKSILTFGSSANEASAHYFDQATLFANKRYKSSWFARDEVISNARSTVTLTFESN